MKRKLIFLDIDGTLTEPGSNTPPQSAVEAIRAAQKRGHLAALCSGRNYGMLSPLLAYGFDAVVASSGGYIECGGAVVYDNPMTPAQRDRVLSVFAENGVFRTVETRTGAYTDEAFKRFLAENAHAGGNSELLRWREQIERSLNIRPMSEYPGDPIYKLVFMSRSMEALREPVRTLEPEFSFCIQDSDQYGIINGELISRAFNKGLAVKRLCAYTGIPLADTIAFGDSMNDLEMMETAGFSICMANGSARLKELSDEVCPAVTEDGVYHALAKHGLI